MSEIVQLYADREKTIKAYPKTVATEVYINESENVAIKLEEKLNKTDIVNDLESGGSDKVLSAEQGKSLNEGLVVAKTKIQDWENYKANGGEVGGASSFKGNVEIRDELDEEIIYKMTGKSGKLSLGRYSKSYPDTVDELFSISYGKDGGSKSFNIGAVSKETNGYTTLPNGLILQWGTVTLPANTGTNTFHLPMTFPNANLNAQATIFDNGNVSSSSACRLLNFGIASIQIANSTNVSMKATYFCIGY